MRQPGPVAALRVALIDDDSGLITVLERRFVAMRSDLEVFGYPPSPEHLATRKLHALIVNPGITGLEYVEWVAARLSGLGLLVCGRSAPVADRVRALRGGADDWITKPCHPDELVARVEAVLRRRRAGELPDREAPVLAGEIAIRPDRFDAYAGERPGSLSRREYELLALLAGAGGRVLQREEIYQRVWGYTMVRGDRSVDVFVRKLRQKLEAISPGWRYVHTHFGVGYRFAAEPADGSAAVPPPPAPGAAPPAGPSAAPPAVKSAGPPAVKSAAPLAAPGPGSDSAGRAELASRGA
jgi:DNA-binding response OmpR family regulator